LNRRLGGPQERSGIIGGENALNSAEEIKKTHPQVQISL
jgi:hypothetical protein